MRILLATSEVHPYSKTGGLGDMVAALGKALAHDGHQIGIVTPLYGGILEKFPQLQRLDWTMELLLGKRTISGEVWTLQPVKNLTIYFVRQPEFFDRNGIYQENGHTYPDNGARFIFFSKAVVHLARYLPWQPEIVHVHDWQVGLVPAMILNDKYRAGWGTAPPTCLTIHNLAYQGVFNREEYALSNLPLDYYHLNGIEFYGAMNCLKGAISYANVLTTVSPRYAREITTEAFGEGLDGLLRSRQGSLVGILNGVDYEEWNTTHNPHLKHPYSPDQMAGKALNKTELQREMGLPERPDAPLFGNISRLVDQKGSNLILGSLEEMLASDIQYVQLGSGSPELEQALLKLAVRYPDKVAVRIGYNTGLSHRIEAACDFYLMPSRFEPCGLNQMYSLRYGTIPIVRATGGLDDSIKDVAEEENEATGIKFYEFSVRALSRAIRKALVLYQTPDLFELVRRNGMETDYSWERTTHYYEAVYERALKG